MNVYKERGYTLLRSIPKGYLLMVTATGKTVARYPDRETALAALAELPDATPPVVDQSITVEWRLAAQTKVEVPKTCINGYGPSCFCLSADEMEHDYYFCWISTCHNQARCLGSCDTHLGETKIHGDRSHIAAQHTQSHVDDDTYPAIIAAVRRGQIRAVSTKPATMHALISATPPQPTLNGVNTPPGMLLRRLGNPGEHTYVLIDKDANIIAEAEDGFELIRLFSE